VYHKAVAFHFPSPAVRSVPSPLSARLTIGQTSYRTESDVELAAVVLEMANMLGPVGEQLQAGDRIIAGSLLHQPITADRTADLGGSGNQLVVIDGSSRSRTGSGRRASRPRAS